jgi:hypothetical protein
VLLRSAATHAEDSGRIEVLSNLGVALQDRYRRGGEVVILEEAVAVQRDVLAATPLAHPKRARRLSDPGVALQGQFECNADVTVIQEAITVHRDAVKVTPADHPDRAFTAFPREIWRQIELIFP